MAAAPHLRVARPTDNLEPYRDRAGVTFEDPDGYRIVLQNAAWTR